MRQTEQIWRTFPKSAGFVRQTGAFQEDCCTLNLLQPSIKSEVMYIIDIVMNIKEGLHMSQLHDKTYAVPLSLLPCKFI